MVRYYKKILVDRPWNRPNLTSSGVLGGDKFACKSLTALQASTYDAWRLFDGIDTGENLWSSTSGQGVFVFYNPNPLKVESLEVVNYYGGISNWYKGSVYGSNDGDTWTILADFLNTSHYGGAEHWSIPINSSAYYKYHKVQILQNVGHSSYAPYTTSAREVYITATQKIISWQECTEEEYNSLPDDSRKILRDIYKIATKKQNLKKVDIVKDFIQPTATLGLDSGALGVIGGQNLDSVTDRTNEAPNAFNGGTATFDKYTNGSVPVFYWIFKINNPSNVTLQSITFTCNSGNIAGSNDGNTWVVLDNGSFASGRKTINITQQFTYYRINVNYVNRYGTNYGIYHDASLSNVILTGTYITQAWQECTEEEYNSLPDDSRLQQKKLFGATTTTTTIENFWEQPVLTSEGSLGGTDYGVTASASVGATNYPPNQAFDNDFTTYWRTSRINQDEYLTFYSPTPIKPKKITLIGQNSNEGETAPKSFKIQVSKNNTDWITLYSGSLDNSVPYTATCTVEATDFYNYIRIYIDEKYVLSNGYYHAFISEVNIVAVKGNPIVVNKPQIYLGGG